MRAIAIEGGKGEADALKMVFSAVQLFLGAEAGAQPTIKGATYLTAQATLNAALIAAFSAMAAASTTPPLSTLAPSFTAIATALTAFQASAASYPTSAGRQGLKPYSVKLPNVAAEAATHKHLITDALRRLATAERSPLINHQSQFTSHESQITTHA